MCVFSAIFFSALFTRSFLSAEVKVSVLILMPRRRQTSRLSWMCSVYTDQGFYLPFGHKPTVQALSQQLSSKKKKTVARVYD